MTGALRFGKTENHGSIIVTLESALEALQAIFDSEMVLNGHRKLKQLVKLLKWMPKHSEISGNQLADGLVRAASKQSLSGTEPTRGSFFS